MRVLVADDFEVLARSIGTGRRREGMAVDVVLAGHDALKHLATTRYDVVVLDRDLPGVHGDEVCRRIAANGAGSRVLMLTAAEVDRLFQRFQRFGDDRVRHGLNGGHGLGLAISPAAAAQQMRGSRERGL